MKYEDCLKKSIESCEFPHMKDAYSKYPVPGKKMWKKCVSKASAFKDDEDYAQMCMAQYEVILLKFNIEIVLVNRIYDVFVDLTMPNVPMKILKAVAAEFDLTINPKRSSAR